MSAPWCWLVGWQFLTGTKLSPGLLGHSLSLTLYNSRTRKNVDISQIIVERIFNFFKNEKKQFVIFRRESNSRNTNVCQSPKMYPLAAWNPSFHFTTHRSKHQLLNSFYIQNQKNKFSDISHHSRSNCCYCCFYRLVFILIVSLHWEAPDH